MPLANHEEENEGPARLQLAKYSPVTNPLVSRAAQAAFRCGPVAMKMVKHFRTPYEMFKIPYLYCVVDFRRIATNRI